MHTTTQGKFATSNRQAWRISIPVTSAWQLVILLLVGLCALPVHAQFRASLGGTVTDPSGAVVPGATVTLVDKDTNQTRTSISDDSGIYNFNALPPDHYKLTAERQGFKVKEITEIVLIPDQSNLLNLALEVGNVQETVTVSGSVAPLLDTGTATLSTTISSNDIQHLPSFNRDVFQLAQLAPGVFGDGSQASGGGSYNLPGNQGPGGSGTQQAGIFQTENGPQVQSLGGQYELNSISVDGISTVSAVWGGTSVITPSEDSIQNVKVISNSYDAEVGRFGGAQIQVTSKSGTNDLHGSVFFKASRPGLNAYQPWNGVGSAKPGTPAARGLNKNQSRFNNYGASLGGPLWKNKLFAFFNFESSPLTALATGQGWYETPQFDQAAAASGSIAAKYLSYTGEAPKVIGLVQRDCASIGLLEGVNCNTTASGLDVGSPMKNVALGTLDPTWVSSGTPGVGGGLDGVPDLALFTTANPTNTSQIQYNGRVDADITGKDHLAFAIYWVPVSSTFYNGPVRPANFWHHSQVNDAFSLIWNHTFSPTLLNEARANAAGWRWNEVATNPQEPFGLPQDNIDDIGSAKSFQYFGAPGPSNFNQWTYDYNDVLTKIIGRHTIKTGGNLTRLYYLNNPVYAARPSFNFRNLWDFANDAPYRETGQFDSKTGVPFANRQDNRVDIWGFFVQDDFKALPNLTINAGLRWSYFGSFSSKQNTLGVLRFGTGSNVMNGLNIRVGGNLYAPQKTNFGPQIGFAWQPKHYDSNLLIRGGFGINYTQNEIAITANGIGNPPTAVQKNFCCSSGNPPVKVAGIQYGTATNINSLFGYPPNPETITQFGTNNLPLPGSNPVYVTAFPSAPKTIVNYHYSLGTEYQMPYDWVATLGYQGSLTRHLLIQSNFNVIASAFNVPLNPIVNFLDYYANTGTGNYNAMIATLRHPFAHQFNLEAQFTWAKAMDQNSGPYFMDPYPYYSQAASGPSDYNVTTAFKLFGLWQPIFFRGANAWIEKLAGGWSLSGILNVHTGFPFNPYYNTVTTGGLFYNGSGYGSLRPTAYLGGAGKDTSNGTFMNPTNPNYKGNGTTYFAPPTYENGPAFPATTPLIPPGIHRNSLIGPGYTDLDASLTKGFGLPSMPVLGENAMFEIRADAYNLFNKLNINGQSIDNRLADVNPNGTFKNVNSDFGVAGSALGSRTVQLQARFSF